MASLKLKAFNLWVSSDKRTTPSIKFVKGSTTWYAPLFTGNENAEGSLNNYYYKLGKLKVTKGSTTYRAPVSARFAKSASGTLSGTIKHSGKTGTTTKEQTVTKSGNANYEFSANGGYSKEISVSFGCTFTTITKKSATLTVNAAKNGGYVTITGATGGSGSETVRGHEKWTVTGTVKTTTTTYPNETKSVTPSATVNYGITYGAKPSTLTVNNGCSVADNSAHSACTVSKTLSGSVAYNESATLSQAYTVNFSGAV